MRSTARPKWDGEHISLQRGEAMHGLWGLSRCDGRDVKDMCSGWDADRGEWDD